MFIMNTFSFCYNVLTTIVLINHHFHKHTLPAWCICNRWLFKMWHIAQFQLDSIIKLLFTEIFPYFNHGVLQSHLLPICCIFDWVNPFPHIIVRFLTLQQTTFEIIVAPGEIARKWFLLLAQLFLLDSIIILSFIGIFYLMTLIISKSSAADLLYVGKGC